jgi:hypothetical protein
MAERFKALVLKTSELKGSVSSNLTPSAKHNEEYTMKKLFTSALVFAFMTSSALAQTFYDQYSGGWNIFGVTGSNGKNPACVMSYKFQDGSDFQLVKDLADGELYIWLQNMEWDIADEVNKPYPLRINFYNKNGEVVGGDFEYYLQTKNTIAIRALDVNTFIPVFMEMATMRLIPTGTIQNAQIPLEGTRDGVNKLAACIEYYEKNKPSSEKNEVPEGLKQNI